MTAVIPDTTKNALLNSAVAGGFVTTGVGLGLFTAFPPTVGSNEVTGGSPAYARKAITHTATAAAGAISPATGLPAVFDVPAGTVKAIAVLSTSTTGGTIVGWSPANASARRAFNVTAAGVTANTIDSPAHGLVAGDSVLVWATIGAGLPTGLAEDTQYFVIATGLTTDVFELSATLGGSAIDITAQGDGDIQKFVPEVFGAQGTYSVSAYSSSLPG